MVGVPAVAAAPPAAARPRERRAPARAGARQSRRARERSAAGARTRRRAPRHGRAAPASRAGAGVYGTRVRSRSRWCVLGLLGSAGYLALQSVYFIGTNSRGLVTMFEGLPYRSRATSRCTAASTSPASAPRR